MNDNDITLLLQKIIEIIGGPNSGSSVGILSTALFGYFAIRQTQKINSISYKLNLYECEFRRFELNIEKIIPQHKLPKPIGDELRRFLTESRLIFEDKK